MSRLFQPAIPIEITQGIHRTPGQFQYGKRMVHIKHINNRWRIREGWWRQEVFREYFQIETPGFTGLIYHDLIEDHWYLQRIQG